MQKTSHFNMLALNKQLRDIFLKPVNKYKVASKSEKGKFYLVEELPSGKFICNCIAGGMGRECRHVRICKNKLKGITKSNYGKNNRPNQINAF